MTRNIHYVAKKYKCGWSVWIDIYKGTFSTKILIGSKLSDEEVKMITKRSLNLEVIQ